MKSLLNVTVSAYKNAKDIEPTQINLLSWLRSDKFISKQEALRAEADPKKRKIKKQSMPMINPTGIFSKRGNEHLEKFSGLVQVDFDRALNDHVLDFDTLKDDFFKHIPEIAYCGRSISGQGWWVLIPIESLEKYKQHYSFIEWYFRRFSLIIDPSCEKISQPRFYSYDPDAYFNHAAKPLRAVYSHAESIQHKGKDKTDTGEGMKPGELYGQTDDFVELLQVYGWEAITERNNRVDLCRPGSTNRLQNAVAYLDDPKHFVVLTDQDPTFKRGTYTPFAVFTVLKCGGDFKEAAKLLQVENDFKTVEL